MGTRGKGANVENMPLGNRSRRKDILQPFRIFYSLVSGQPIWTGNDDPVKDDLFEPTPQAIQPRPIEGGTTIAIITENILRSQRLTLAVYVRGEARNLLVNRLCQRLPLGRYAGIDGCSHPCPPSVVGVRVQRGNRRGARGAQSN